MLRRHLNMGHALRPLAIVIAGLVVATLFVSGVASAIARGYETTDTGLQVGMVAALSTEGTSTVERATQANTKRVVGVVTTFDNSSVTLASGQTTLLVESEGQVQAFISDLNGIAKQGDQLVMSPLKGVLMRAADNEGSTVVAIAAQGVSDSTTEGTEYTVNHEGKSKQTKITKVQVNLNTQGANNAGQKQDSSLAKLGRAVVGKQVGEERVLAALIIFIVVLIAEGGIIYGAITSSITALGRNPMARKIIRREMLQVMSVAVGVLLIGLGAVYGVLWF